MATILGLKLTGHDTGAALVANERIIAIAEERLCRVKHSPSIFPEKAILYCLQALKVSPESIDLIVIDQIGLRNILQMKKLFLEWQNSKQFLNARIEIINHHDAHAASVFFCSPFKESAILIYDGAGEQFINHYGVPVVETETLYYGSDNVFLEFQKTTHVRTSLGFLYTWGIGKLYSEISRNYLGFGSYNEGKMMGLAAYGDERILKQFPYDRWFYVSGNHVLCNPKIIFSRKKVSDRPSLNHGLLWKLKNIKNILRWKIAVILRYVVETLTPYAYRGGSQIIYDPLLFEPIKFLLPARTNELLPDHYYSSVAYAAQSVLEKVAIRWGSRVKTLSRSDNICIAGGVGLNIDANRNFLEKVGFKNIFVQPAASDTGIPLGCALYGAHMILKQPRFWEMKSASLGRTYGEQEILDATKKYKNQINITKSSSVTKEVARLIAEGNIIGWFHGGSEYGPRALGNRSILCDARNKDMKNILNNKVKHRELWRPFAASVLVERQSEWFELDYPSPFMLLDALVRKEKRKLVPSIVHVDNTCRIQAVSLEQNSQYYNLLLEFEKITGVPLVLNTSFNLGGEPIVETPEDALRTFLNTKMDYLVLEDYIVEKK